MSKSSEEALAKINANNEKQLNKGIKDENKGQEFARSLDANKLFNKISPKTAKKYMKQSVLKSQWSMEINTRELKVFLATNMPNEEIVSLGLEEVIPRRRSTQGKSPQLKGAEMNARPSKIGESKFVIKTETIDPTENNKSKKIKKNYIDETLSSIEIRTIENEIKLRNENKNILSNKSS